MNLPKPLAPWAKYLNLFPNELGLALAPLVAKISLLVGSLEKLDDTNKGEPDGFDGLTRRGSYEKLLISEWLLAEEMPDEFARRASMGEHVFLKTARREPGSSRISIALFDTGPDQIGTPRIAHIAILIVLAQRAESASAKFGWACLQRPNMPIHSGLSPSEVTKLLNQRTLRTVTGNELREWQHRLEQDVSSQEKDSSVATFDWAMADDVWVIGSPFVSSLSLANKFSELIIRPGLDPNINNLLLTVKSNKRFTREVTLELPDERTCVRLIRAPFDNTVTNPVVEKQKDIYKPVTNIIFGSFKNKLFARNNADLVSYPIADRPGVNPGRPKRLTTQTNYNICAAGFSGSWKKTAFLSKKDDRILLHYPGSINNDPPEGHYKITETLQGVSLIKSINTKKLNYLAPIFPLSSSQIAFVDNTRTLFELSKSNNATDKSVVGNAQIKAISVVAIDIYPGNILFFVTDNDNALYFNRLSQNEQAAFPLEVSFSSILIGFSSTWKRDAGPAIAIELRKSEWQILRELAWPVFKEKQNIILPTNGEVIGFRCEEKTNSLVVLETNRQEVNMYSDNGVKTKIFTASAKIKQFLFFRFHASHHSGDCLAYFTEDDELIIYSIEIKKVMNRFCWNEET